ncbi:MAG: hypothetical protein PHU95_03155 [Candidatus Thermoplasmatota archaeon]|nr:hypothetical protein [Candidatus Thermoplasmatota archaeon]MDD5778428.1 hypothetical protein [Candidatus Thermoplasmatota archaeon]
MSPLTIKIEKIYLHSAQDKESIELQVPPDYEPFIQELMSDAWRASDHNIYCLEVRRPHGDARS